MPSKIFIGGTGRSGTSILYRALGCHRDIYDLPKEMRFIVDPDGLMDLVDSLTIRFSPTKAREALYKFERLMRVYLTTPQQPYPDFDFAGWFGQDYYWQRLERFCSELVEQEFEGYDWHLEPPEYPGRLVNLAVSLRDRRRQMMGEPPLPTRLTLPRSRLKLVKYFSDRSRLVELAASFVDDLFLYAARQHGKQTWIEKTPNNLLHIDFLWELFPDSLFIHIKRDPRGIVHSMLKFGWTPSTVEGVCLFLRDVYDRWYDLEKTLDLNRHCYLELKLEDLAREPASYLEKIVSYCGLPYSFENLPEITIEKVNYWKNVMTKREIEIVNELLAEYIDRMGYEVHVP